MSQWKKSPVSLVARFHELVPDDAQVERRQMFGYPCCFVNGNMFMSLHQESFVLRLPADVREVFIHDHGARLFSPFAGRVMREYVVVPPELLEQSDELGHWIGAAFRCASELPPRSKR